MSYISVALKVYRALIRGLHYAHALCHLATRVNSYVQRSNASDALKAQSTALLASTNAFCTALQTFVDDLPGN